MEKQVTTTTSPNNNELNFFDLINIFYKYKVLIIIVTLFFGIFAYAITYIVPEKWKSVAIVKEAKISDVQAVLDLKKNYDDELNLNLIQAKLSRKIDNSKKDSQPKDDENSSNSELVNKLFKNFYMNAMSIDNQQEFLKNTELFKKAIIKNKDQNEVLAELQDNLDVKCKESDLFLNCELSFISNSAKDAQNSLQQFIIFINEVSSKDILSELTINLKQAISSLEIELRNIEIDTLKSKKILNKTDLDDDFIGYNNLSSINVKYPAKYYQIQESLKHLKSLVDNDDIKLNNFSYQQSPNLPLNKESPKRLLFLICGLILGILVSCYTALHLNYTQKKDKK